MAKIQAFFLKFTDCFHFSAIRYWLFWRMDENISLIGSQREKTKRATKIKLLRLQFDAYFLIFAIKNAKSLLVSSIPSIGAGEKGQNQTSFSIFYPLNRKAARTPKIQPFPRKFTDCLHSSTICYWLFWKYGKNIHLSSRRRTTEKSAT